MSMPGDHIAAGPAGHGRLRASHADREQVIEVLKTAFADGRLTKDEFGARIGQVLTSRTYAELTEVTADLPPESTGVGARPPRELARTRPRVSMNTALSAGALAMLAALIGMMAAVVTRSAIVLIIAVVIIAIVGSLAFGGMMVSWWRDRAR